MKIFITGGAGFIGSNLADRMLARGHHVIVYDNLSTGRRDFLANAFEHPGFRFVQGDLLDPASLKQAMAGAERVFHLAANADVRHGLEHPGRDLEQNTVATFNVLEAMRATGVRELAFSSTGSIYGDAEVIPTPEDAPFPVQTSLYGASKLAGEGLIEAYCHGYGLRAWIFRFVSILGERYTHGHVWDFVRQLLRDPTRLTVLGDGQQRKSYLYVGDCLNAIETAIDSAGAPVNIFNLGTDEYCRVMDSVGWICEMMGLSPRVDLTGGKRGWIGDNPFIFLDTRRIQGLGWRSRLTIREAVQATVRYLLDHRALLDQRQ
jgi:UDP-glucose 4-epimerase